MTYTEFQYRLLNSRCTNCDLYKTRRNIVGSRGNPSAPVMLIGEAPGAEEDATGKPFVGTSGQVLDEMLYFIGIDPAKDILVTNIIHCRPPEDRKPKTKEVSACESWLLKEIRIMKPKFIVGLGGTACEWLAKRKVPMNGFAGKLFGMSEFPHFDWPWVEKIGFMYHPAALLYDETLKPTALEHWKKFKLEVARCLNR